MKTTVITELLKIEALQTTTDEQIVEKATAINAFIEKQDGFLDAELIKALDGRTWYFVYHIENLEKLKAVGEKIRTRKLFDVILPLIEPGSMTVNFHQQYNKW